MFVNEYQKDIDREPTLSSDEHLSNGSQGKASRLFFISPVTTKENSDAFVRKSPRLWYSKCPHIRN